METVDHLSILRKAGLVLVVVGALDIGLMIYSIVSGAAYSSSLNVFAVIAGIFLLRGSLRAASLVRWFALFFASGLVSLAVAWPLFQPADLTLTQAQINPVAFVVSAAFLVFALALFVWLTRALGSAPVLEARRRIGQRPSEWRAMLAVGAGIVLVAVLAAVSVLIQRSDSGSRAMLEARAKLGDGYKYHVSSLNYSSSGSIEHVSGVVTAWKPGTVQEVRFGW
jgi:hypothetical protein